MKLVLSQLDGNECKNNILETDADKKCLGVILQQKNVIN